MSTNTKTEIRVTKQWWASVDGVVTFVTGYRCDPNLNYWWCPEVGYSLSENAALFETEAEALTDAIKEVREDISASEKQLENLEARRLKLK